MQTVGMKALVHTTTNPAELGYPATFPVELALRVASPRKICEAYGISREEFEALVSDPHFMADLNRAKEMVRKEGMSFRLKAQLQSDELLKTSWKIIHDAKTPATVRADLIKFTIRVAGLDASKDQGQPGANGPSLNIQINL